MIYNLQHERHSSVTVSLLTPHPVQHPVEYHNPRQSLATPLEFTNATPRYRTIEASLSPPVTSHRTAIFTFSSAKSLLRIFSHHTYTRRYGKYLARLSELSELSRDDELTTAAYGNRIRVSSGRSNRMGSTRDSKGERRRLRSAWFLGYLRDPPRHRYRVSRLEIRQGAFLRAHVTVSGTRTNSRSFSRTELAPDGGLPRHWRLLSSRGHSPILRWTGERETDGEREGERERKDCRSRSYLPLFLGCVFYACVCLSHSLFCQLFTIFSFLPPTAAATRWRHVGEGESERFSEWFYGGLVAVLSARTNFAVENGRGFWWDEMVVNGRLKCDVSHAEGFWIRVKGGEDRWGFVGEIVRWPFV